MAQQLANSEACFCSAQHNLKNLVADGQFCAVYLLATEDGRATQQPAGNQAGFCNSLHSPQLFVGQPGMDAVCRHLTAGCITSWAHKVSKQYAACQRWA